MHLCELFCSLMAAQQSIISRLKIVSVHCTAIQFQQIENIMGCLFRLRVGAHACIILLYEHNYDSAQALLLSTGKGHSIFLLILFELT